MSPVKHLSTNWLNWFHETGRPYLKRYGGPVFLGLAIITIPLLIVLDSQRLLAYSFHLDPWYVFLSVVLEFSSLIFTVPAWHLILTRLNVQSTYRDDLRIYCYSLIGFVIPGGIWPFVSRATFYEQQGVSAVKVLVATMVEVLLMGLAGLVVYSLTLLIIPQAVVWHRPEIAILAISGVFILIQPPFFNRISGKILSWFEQTKQQMVDLSYQDLVILLILEAVTIIIAGTAIYYLLQSFVSVSPSAYFSVVGAWGIGVAASNLFFWFPGKPILRDGAMIIVLTQILPPSLAIAFVIIIRIWTMLSMLLSFGLAWSLLRRRDHAF